MAWLGFRLIVFLALIESRAVRENFDIHLLGSGGTVYVNFSCFLESFGIIWFFIFLFITDAGFANSV